MTDILYVLTDKKNRGDGRELRLSLRSLEENCKDLGKIYIATDKLPKWIKNVEHIEVCDLFEEEPEKNVLFKIMFSCIPSFLPKISDDFLLMNDDYFMTKPFIASEYPFYFNGYLDLIENPSSWQEVQNKTINYLKSNGIDKIKNYCVHTPVLYNKDRFYYNFLKLHLLGKKEERGYNHKLLYGNMFSEYDVYMGDCKTWNMEQFYKNYYKGCISTPDDSKEFLDILEIIFNKKSRFEK